MTHRPDPLSTLSAAQLPLAAGLRACAEEMSYGWQRRQFLRLSRQLEAGIPWQQVLQQAHGAAQGLAEILTAGMESGRITSVLEEYLRTQREVSSLWRTLMVGLLYPVFLLGLAGVVFSGFLVLTVPRMKTMFMDFGIELPGMTLLILGISDLLLVSWPFLLGLLAAVALAIAFERYLPFRSLRIRLLQRLPLIGRVWRYAAAAEFCTRLSVLVEARMPLPKAMAVLAHSLRDPPLRQVSLRLARRLEEGETGESLALGVPGVLPELAGVFRWAHDAELFADGLRSQAVVFESQARIHADQFGFVVAPAISVIVGTGVMMTVVAMFTPLIRLLNALS